MNSAPWYPRTRRPGTHTYRGLPLRGPSTRFSDSAAERVSCKRDLISTKKRTTKHAKETYRQYGRACVVRRPVPPFPPLVGAGGPRMFIHAQARVGVAVVCAPAARILHHPMRGERVPLCLGARCFGHQRARRPPVIRGGSLLQTHSASRVDIYVSYIHTHTHTRVCVCVCVCVCVFAFVCVCVCITSYLYISHFVAGERCGLLKRTDL